ncbi:3-keto-5-aminohexanoate cleavage protein [Azospirillum halopraeferens]|uniref:3-keto-5-aminohexanoate cleavage protein n=1 Tax=Azospirillum halopraeferens TaxID=34010 RepID=UPI00040E8D86|nr:3-keto-5-aminohexanoate cleavage protein [Azospirillum halopraeferens]
MTPPIPPARTPLILMVAPNGARRTKADHPALPMTPAELARTAAECRDAGASLLHLHVRDSRGRHILDADAYRDALAAVRDAVGESMILQITTEAVGLYDRHAQMAVTRSVRPEAVSLAVRELIPDVAAEPEAGAFLEELHRAGTLVQYITYGPDEVLRLVDLSRRGVVPEPAPSVLFVLGRYGGGADGRPSDLCPFLTAWTDGGGDWAVCAFGAEEAACAGAAIAMGGHARVGFENNLRLPDGTPAAGNADLVSVVAGAARAIGRPPADADTARRILAHHSR